MGREIRRVPANWQHPTATDKYSGREVPLPMYGQHFDARFAKWLADFDRMRAGNLDAFEAECYPRGLADWLQDEGKPPNPAYYRPWKDDEAAWAAAWVAGAAAEEERARQRDEHMAAYYKATRSFEKFYEKLMAEKLMAGH